MYNCLVMSTLHSAHLLQCLFVNRLQYFEMLQHVLRSFLHRRLYAYVMSYLLNALNQQILLVLCR